MAGDFRLGRMPHDQGAIRRAARAVGALALLALLSAPAARPAAAFYPARSRADAFPLAMDDSRGKTVRLPYAPRRVVSLAPSMTETVFLLGRESLLSGVTRYCNFPPAAARLPKVGGISDPDVERIVSAAPDLVLCTTDGNPRDKVEAIERMRIPAFCAAPQDIEGILDAVERVGALLGVPAEGKRQAALLRQRTARARRPASGAAPRVLFVVSTNPVIAAGAGTFMDELIRLSGGVNAASRFATRYPRLSTEELLAASPDVILVASMVGVDRFSPEVSRWKQVPAFRDGAVDYVDGDIVTRPGPRMVDALETVSRRLDRWRAARGRGGRR
jgi:iron complex transport system substrate-binding protein